MILALLLSTVAFAGKCPAIDGTYENKQDFGGTTLSVHVRGQKISQDGKHWYRANGSSHFEKDENIGDSRISFECRGGKLFIHQDLVRKGELISGTQKLPAKGLMKLKPRGKDLEVEVSGRNPVLQMVKGGLFTRKK